MGLVALLLMIVLISVCACAYMNTAKSWTVAASHVDDAMGSMDGYAVILYPGTTEPEPEESYIPKAEGGLFAALSDDGAAEVSSEEDVASNDVEGLSEGAFASESSDGSVPASSSVGTLSSSADSASEGQLGEGVEAGEEELSENAAKARSFAERFLPLISDSTEEDPEPLFVSDVRNDYMEKNASVLTLDALSAERYAEPCVFLLDGKRVGVFSVDAPISQTRLNVFLEFFSQKKADVVLCLTSLGSNLASFDGIDIVVVTNAAEGSYSTIGSDEDGAFVVLAPERGSVGAIFITSNNVVSSKVIDEL